MAEEGVEIDASEAIKILKQLKGPAMVKYRNQLLNQGGLETMATMKPLMSSKTGRMRQSVVMRREGLNSVIVGPTVNYAKYVTQGTRPHPIFPVNKKALFWSGASHPVKSVQHPGTRANKFQEFAQREMDAKIGRIASRLMEQHLRSA